MEINDIIKIIGENTCVVIPDLSGHQFKPSDALRDLGANSVDRSEIVMMTLESLMLRTPLRDFAAAENIGELAGILYEKLQPK